MAEISPLHRLDLPIAERVALLLDVHRSVHGSARMDATDDDGGGAGGADEGAADDNAGGAADDKGFPANTPVAEMTADQRAAYWQDKARKHEQRVKSLGITPEQLKDLRDKADRHDALERELMSDKDKAVAEAADKAKADALASVTPRLILAEFKAAAAGRIAADRLDVLLEDLDLSKYLTDSGDVDTVRVQAKVDAFAPDKGNEGNERRGPRPHGQGVRGAGSSSNAGGSVAAGRELYQQRHARKSA